MGLDFFLRKACWEGPSIQWILDPVTGYQQRWELAYYIFAKISGGLDDQPNLGTTDQMTPSASFGSKNL